MGETFGRYQLLGLLGQGGMGRLYIAERRGIQGFVKIVALKRIQPHLADSKQLREMFLNEARIAARLEHPNIVATYELGEVDGKYFISMEYLPGEDLSAIIAGCQDGRMPVAIAAALTQQAAQGLHYAHEARDGQGKPIGLVHRDVSPRNIFVTYHGVVKLLDFGVVRGPEKQKSIPGVFKGKYGYCAPEQIEGGHIDRRTDVFCLGIALWECLTGARLFDASTDVVDHRCGALAPDRGTEHAAPGGSAGAGRDHVARARARSGAALSQRATTCPRSSIVSCSGATNVRPARAVGRWMETIFGAERAALKKAISQGGEIETTLERLFALNAVRPTSDTDNPATRATRIHRRPREGPAARVVVDQLRQQPVGRQAALGAFAWIRRSGGPASRGARRRAGAPRSAPAAAARRGRRAPPSMPRARAPTPAAGNRRCRSCSASGWCWAASASSPSSRCGENGRSRTRRGAPRRARRRPWRYRASRRGRTCSSTAARAGCARPPC